MIRALALCLALACLALPAAAFDALRDARIDPRPDAAAPLGVPFLDEAGRPVTLAALGAGRPIVLAPVLHACPTLCDVTLAGLGQAIAALPLRPDRDFALVAFGIDPRETPADAAAALARLRAAVPETAGAHALTGTAPAVAAVTDALGYHAAPDPEGGGIAHIAAVAVLAPDGRLAAWLPGVGLDPADLRRALGEAGKGRLGRWSDRLLLLCFHYDPRTGRVDALATTALRAAGIATVAAGALLVGLALRAERRRRR